MTNAADDFDALFEEVSAQSKKAAPAPAPAPAPAAAEDDLESLFDQVSSGAAVSAPAPSPAPAAVAAGPAAAAEGGEGAEGDGTDKPMFERLGGIVRLLHDSLRELGYDLSLIHI